MSEIQSVARALKILNTLGEADEGVGVTELARAMDMDKGSVSRVMQTLAQQGFAEQDPSTRRYTLGPQLVVLGQRLLARMPLRDQAHPYLRQLVDATGECAHLAVAAQGQVLYVDQVESAATLRVNTGVGTLAPMHSTALGKCLMAFGNAAIPEPLTAFTTRTITSAEALKLHLEQTRRQGYAIDDEEYSYDVRCVAVPVINHQNQVVAAIGISGPAGRMGLERLPELASVVREIGTALSNRLSFKRG